MQKIGKFNVNISILPNGLGKYMAFKINKILVLLGACSINSSLEKLVKKLTGDNFRYLSQKFCGKQLQLVKQKGIYPYEYMNSFEEFDGTKLPDRDDFYSSLKDEHVSDKDYEHAVKVCDWFEIKAVGDYLDLNLRTDFLLMCLKDLEIFS